jgi:peptidylprolyl isomerase
MPKAVELKDGDFIYIDYTGRVKDSKLLLDTTKEEVANAAGVEIKEHEMVPQLVIIGDIRDFVRGFEPRLRKIKLGETKTFDIPPEEAYGSRRRDLIETKNIREFRQQGIHPKVGQTIQIQEKSGVTRSGLVRRIGSGRVMLDFNNPHAEKTISYKVTIVKKVTTDKQKIQALINRRVGDALAEKFKTTLKAGELAVEIPREAFYTEKLYLVKVLLATELFKYIPKIKKVVYSESHERPEVAKPKKPKKATTKKASPKKKAVKKKATTKK